MAERRDTKNRLLSRGEYQKSDGRYMYKYVDKNGHNRFIYSWTLTQTDRVPKGKHSGKCLRELEKEIAKDLSDGLDTFNAKKMTLNDFFKDYMEQKQELKPSTRSLYMCVYSKHIYNNLGKVKLSEIKYSDIKKFYNKLISDAGLSIGSIGGVNTILHPIFSIAVRDGYIRANPTDGIMAEIKKNNNFEVEKKHSLTESEQNAFVDFIRSHSKYHRWIPLFAVFLGTGCRLGEVVGLTWNDCDFENNIISINHSLRFISDEKTKKTRLYISTPKTKAGIREIPMFEEVKKILLQERMRQMKDGFNQFVIDGYSGFIFSNRFNRVLTCYYVDNLINRIVRDYNIEETTLAEIQNREPLLLPHFSPHILRHTFCTRMCENESNIKVIQEIMGHSDISVTMNIYNEATLDKKKEAFINLEGKIKVC